MNNDKEFCAKCGGGYLNHQWGCPRFDWDGLYDAMEYIRDEYSSKTGVYPIMKEKYSTIRYEIETLWLLNSQDTAIFNEILQDATHKWPHLKDYILDDWSWRV